MMYTGTGLLVSVSAWLGVQGSPGGLSAYPRDMGVKRSWVRIPLLTSTGPPLL